MIELLRQNSRQSLLYLVVLLCIIAGVMINSIVMLVGIALICGSILANKWDDFPVLFFLFSFANILKISPGTSSLFTYLCMLYIIVNLIRNRRFDGRVFISLLLFFTYIVLFDIRGIGIATKIVFGVLIIHCFSEIKEKNIMKHCALCYCDGLIVSMILSQNSIFYNRVLPYMRVVYLQAGTELYRSCGLFTDPNYCSMAIMMGIAALLILYYHNEIKIGFWTRVIAMAALGLLTYSKTYILVLVFTIIYAMLFIFLKRRSPVFVVAGIGIWILVYLILNGRIEAINRILYRFENVELTSGRMDKNIYYIQYLLKNIDTLLVGTGISIDRLPGQNNVHNFPIEALQRIGLIGTISYVAVLFVCTESVRYRKKCWVSAFPIIVMTVMYMSLAGLTSYEFPFYSSICILGLSFGHIKAEELSKHDAKTEQNILIRHKYIK